MSKILKHITFLVLKIMGIKNNFSQDPIDYSKIRKSDIKSPPKSFYNKFNVAEKVLSSTNITIISNTKDNTNEKRLILFIPGGAFISGPAQHHWSTLEKIVEKTDVPIWLVDYPKSPEHDILYINQNIDEVYSAALKKIDSNKIILIGDSVGATLIMSLVQRLIHKNEKVPSKLILITPVFDSSMSNKEIDEIDKEDPMLSKIGILSAKKMCAQKLELKNPMISPLYGNFNGFPKTILFVGGKDIMCPDAILGSKKMEQSGVELELMYEPEMPHIYPLLPLMTESKKALSNIISKIN